MTEERITELEAENARLKEENDRLKNIVSTPFRFSVTTAGIWEVFVRLDAEGGDRFVIRRMQ